jgi:PmbA protein
MLADNMKVDLVDLAEKLMKKADKSAFDQLEIFLSRETVTSAEIEKGSVKKGERIFDMGFSARAVKGKSVGFSHSSSLDERDVLNVLNESITLARIVTPDPDFQSLPKAEPYPEVFKSPDKHVSSIDVGEAVDMAMQVEGAAHIDPRIYSINVSIDLVSAEAAVINTLGISAEENDTLVSGSASVVSKTESEMSHGFEFEEARRIKDIDLRWIGREAASESIKSLGAKKISSGKLPVIFAPRVAAGIISSGIAGASSAENIQKKRSYLTGKLGQVIGSNEITVTDDGTLANGIATSRFDAEGSPRTQTVIVEKGVLKSYLHSSYTANKEGVKNTGNASRGGGWDYRASPSIGHTNLILEPGKHNLQQLLSEVNEGILVLYTGDRPNLATGELSAQVTAGFKIEKGDISYPLKQASVGINLLDLLTRVEEIGSDSRQISGVITPSIRISEAAISGGS